MTVLVESDGSLVGKGGTPASFVVHPLPYPTGEIGTCQAHAAAPHCHLLLEKS